ncbi:MAG: hypothetical protein HY689_01050 [Chloroflexi bacterium]|nr:hypothetical protein [Chloroflexota bacterium]
MPAPRTILLATTNPAKIERLRWALDGSGLVPLTTHDVPPFAPVAETGASYEENAILKAVAASAACAGLAVATDGGITIPALGAAWNGLFTGRAAGPGATDTDRVRHLLSVMAGRRGEERRVSWTEALALADRGQVLASWSATGNEGYLAESFTPDQVVPGFWVATLWYYPQLGRRYCELTEAEQVCLDTPWTVLRERVQEYLRGYLATGAAPPPAPRSG